MSCYLPSCLATRLLVITFCYSSLHFVAHCRTLLLYLILTFAPCCSHLATLLNTYLCALLLAPCYFAFLFMPCCYPLLLPCCLHLTILPSLPSRFAAPCALVLVTPCYSPHLAAHRHTSLLTFTPWCSPSFSGTFCQPPNCCFVALLLAFMPCCFAFYVSWYSLPTFLCRWRSLEQQQHQASSNKSKFAFPKILTFFLSFIFCLFVLFLFVILF